MNGKNLKERMKPGSKINIKKLEEIDGRFPVDIILYFEDELARTSTYQQDLVSFAGYPEDNRPFIPLSSFMKIQREMNPAFDQALVSVPMLIEIIACEEQNAGNPVIKGLLPFLDEMDLQ